MPIDLAENSSDDEWVLLHPGAYKAVLQRVCEQNLHNPGEWLEASESPKRLAEFERQQAASIAELVAHRGGEPVHCLSCHLPDGLLDLFPRGQGSYLVTPDDRVTMKPTRGR